MRDELPRHFASLCFTLNFILELRESDSSMSSYFRTIQRTTIQRNFELWVLDAGTEMWAHAAPAFLVIKCLTKSEMTYHIFRLMHGHEHAK